MSDSFSTVLFGGQIQGMTQNSAIAGYIEGECDSAGVGQGPAYKRILKLLDECAYWCSEQGYGADFAQWFIIRCLCGDDCCNAILRHEEVVFYATPVGNKGRYKFTWGVEKHSNAYQINDATEAKGTILSSTERKSLTAEEEALALVEAICNEVDSSDTKSYDKVAAALLCSEEYWRSKL